MKKINFLFFTLFLYNGASNNYAQSFTIIDQVTFGSNMEDDLNNMILTPDDGYLMCGMSFGGISGDKTDPSFGYSDYWLVKFNNSLQPQWQKSFGGNSGEVTPSIINVSGGGYLLVGSSGSPISGNKTVDTIGGGDMWVIKLNATGGIVWQNVYGGDSTESNYGNSVVELNDGSFVIACNSKSGISGNKSENSRGGTDYWIIKIDSLGNLIWDKTYGGSGYEQTRSICKDIADNIYIVGESDSPISGDKTIGNFGTVNIWALKIDSGNGNKIWEKVYGGDEIDGGAKAIEADGYIYISSNSSSNIFGTKTEANKGWQDFWILKVNTINGNVLWDKTLGGPGIESPIAVTYSDNKVYITGGILSGVTGGDITETSRGGQDIWTVCLDTSSTLIWQKRIGGSLNDIGLSVFQTTSGNTIIGAASESNISFEKDENSRGGYDYWIVQLDVNLSVNEFDKNNNLIIYPNPSDSYLNIDDDFVSGSLYSIYDMTGKLVQQGKIDESALNIKQLNSGIYSLVVNKNEGTFAVKFIKE